MELRELRAFVAVAEHGGVARAASSLYLSPSSVSHAITALEAGLGVALFQRVARGMVLTDAGRAMLGPAHRALEDVAAVEAAVVAGEGVLTGRVSVVPGRIYLVPVIEVMARFHADHPHVVINFREPQNQRVVEEMVRSGEVDFGVMSSDSVPSDLAHGPVGTQTEAVVLPVSHPLAGRHSVSFAELDGLDVIAADANSPFRSMFDRMCRAASVTPRIVAESDHLQTMIELVRLGVGVTVAPVECVHRLLGDEAVVVPLTPTTSRCMSLVRTRQGDAGPAADALWRYLSAGRPLT